MHLIRTARQLMRMETRQGGSSILVECIRQRNGMVSQEALHRSMCSATASRDIAYISTLQELPQIAAEHEQVIEYAVPIRTDGSDIAANSPTENRATHV